MKVKVTRPKVKISMKSFSHKKDSCESQQMRPIRYFYDNDLSAWTFTLLVWIKNNDAVQENRV